MGFMALFGELTENSSLETACLYSKRELMTFFRRGSMRL